MPVLEHEDAIKEYYEEVKDKFPGISFTEFSKVCRSPFEYVRVNIKKDTLPFIYIKYFGKFRPSQNNIRTMIRVFKKKVLIENQYQDKILFLKQYLQALKDHDKKNPNEEEEDHT